MNIIDDFEKAKQAIYDHVGFVEDYVIYPIENRTEMYWKLVDNCFFGGKGVRFAKTTDELNSNNDDFYEDQIYTQRFYKKWVYRGKQYTMIFVDTHTDGNKFFAIYDNNKEVKDE